MLTKPFEERVRVLTQQIAGRILGRSGISPNMLTAAGLLLTLSVPIVLAEGYFVWVAFWCSSQAPSICSTARLRGRPAKRVRSAPLRFHSRSLY